MPIQTFPHLDDTFSDSIEKLYTHGSVLHNVIRKCQKYEIKIVKAYL